MFDKTEQEIMKNWQGNMNKPIVSVCTITYNHEKYIKEAINSFLMQETNFPFEIVIGEDCSTDDTLHILLKYQKKYPTILKLLTTDKNLGVIKNLLRTVRVSQGQYIALCEGDDYWIDNSKLQKQYNAFMLYPKISGIYHRAHVINDKKRIIKIIPYQGKNYDDLSNFFNDFYQIPTCSVMFRNFFKEEGFYKFRKMFRNANYILDYLIDTLIIEHGQYFFLDEVMSCYRIIEDNSSFSAQKIETVEQEMLQTRDNIDCYFNYKYHQELVNNKEKIKLSILFKTYKQGGIKKFFKKITNMTFKEFYRLIINILKYKALKVNK